VTRAAIAPDDAGAPDAAAADAGAVEAGGVEATGAVVALLPVQAANRRAAAAPRLKIRNVERSVRNGVLH
jgi:hypothetical protein